MGSSFSNNQWLSCSLFLPLAHSSRLLPSTKPKRFPIKKRMVEPDGKLGEYSNKLGPIVGNEAESRGQTSHDPLLKRAELHRRWKSVLQLSLEKWPILLKNIRPWKSVRRFIHYMFFRIWTPGKTLKNMYYLDLERPGEGQFQIRKIWVNIRTQRLSTLIFVRIFTQFTTRAATPQRWWYPPPALYGIFREQDSPIVERFGCVKKCVEIDAYLATNAIALRTHTLRIVERKGIGIAHERLPDARVQQPQHRIDIGNGPHCRVGSAAKMFLVDNNGHAQVFDGVGVWLGVAGQEVTDERAEGFVQLAARFGGNGIENDGRFPRPGYTGKDSDFALRNAQRYILQVVFSCAAYCYIFLRHNPFFIPI